METTTNIFFPNFLRECQKVQNRNNFKIRSYLASEETVKYDVPQSYIEYNAHVNNINKFKDTFVSYSILDELTRLLKTGETIRLCREYVGNINTNWNQWVICYISMSNLYNYISVWFSNIAFALNESIKALGKLVHDKDDKIDKENLKNYIGQILEALNNSNNQINIIVEKIENFKNNFDEKLKNELKKIVDRLNEESTLQQKERDSITARIKQLQNDISSYNASIVALAMAMGLSIALVTISFPITPFLSFVVGLFVLPAVGASIAATIKISQKLKAAKAEIESYGDYKNEFNVIITALANMSLSVQQTIKEADGIKTEISAVSAPWKALKQDLKDVREKIVSNIDYVKLLKSFKNVDSMWENLTKNLSYLNLQKCVHKVVQTDITDFDANVIMEKVKENGISMSEYLVA